MHDSVRVLLADDHSFVLRSIKQCLEPDFEVVGQVGDGRALIDQALLLNPDVVVVDISMPEMNGIEAVREFQSRGCAARVVFLTVHAEPELVENALSTGAQGYVLKQRARARAAGGRCSGSSGPSLPVTLVVGLGTFFAKAVDLPSIATCRRRCSIEVLGSPRRRSRGAGVNPLL